MKVRKFKSVWLLGIVLILQICSIVKIEAYTMPIVDDVDDVYHLNDLQPDARGDFHNEIDIVSADIINNSLVMTFQEPPTINLLRSYGGYIYWWGQFNIFNYTSWRIGNNIFTEEVVNYVDIRLEFTSNESEYYRRVDNAVTQEGTKLLFPILNYTILPNYPNPPHFMFAASYFVSGELTYVDHLPEIFQWTPPPETTPSTKPTEISGIFIYPVVCIALSSVIIVKIKRKKN